MPVSAVDCVQPALQHTRQQLFTRFRIGQWSRLALVGILAAEVHVGGCNFGNVGQLGHYPRKRGMEFLPSSRAPFDLPSFVPRHIPEHLSQFIGLIVVAIFVAVVLG
ncbi:MAG: hypothetical protein WBP91_00830, partial [Terriglobales bacterium]